MFDSRYLPGALIAEVLALATIILVSGSDVCAV
jgi:hypothetical protein